MILAIIALVAVPVLLNVIEKSRKGAFESSLYNAFDSLDYYKLENKLSDIPEEGIAVSELSLKGKNQFTSGTFKEVNSIPTVENFSNGKYCANGSRDNFIITKGNCEKQHSKVLKIHLLVKKDIIEYLKKIN